MKWRVVGCDRITRTPITTTIEAPDLQSAGTMSARKGIDFDTIEPVNSPSAVSTPSAGAFDRFLGVLLPSIQITLIAGSVLVLAFVILAALSSRPQATTVDKPALPPPVARQPARVPSPPVESPLLVAAVELPPPSLPALTSTPVAAATPKRVIITLADITPDATVLKRFDRRIVNGEPAVAVIVDLPASDAQYSALGFGDENTGFRRVDFTTFSTARKTNATAGALLLDLIATSIPDAAWPGTTSDTRCDFLMAHLGDATNHQFTWTAGSVNFTYLAAKTLDNDVTFIVSLDLRPR